MEYDIDSDVERRCFHLEYLEIMNTKERGTTLERINTVGMLC